MHRRKKVFLTLWLSYIAILIIPVAIAAAMYSSMSSTMVDNANRSNLAMLEQIKQMNDSQMQEIDRLIMQIASHPKLQTLWSLPDSERYIQYYEAVSALKNINNGNTFVHNFYIHLRNQDTIISPTLKTDIKTYFRIIYPFKNKSVEQIKEQYLTGYHFKTYWPAISIGEPAQNVITTTVSLPLGEKEKTAATLVLMIDEEKIFNMLRQIEWANSSLLYILDETGQMLTSTSGINELPQELREITLGASHYQSFQLNGKQMMLSYTKGENGWQYMSLIPKQLVLKKVNEARSWALWLLAVTFVVGSAAAYWMAYRSYSPIRNMVLTLLNGKSAPAASMGNEYEFIQSSIQQNLAEGKQLKQMIDGHAPVVKAYFLMRLLKGQAEPDLSPESSLDFMGLQLQHDYVFVLIVEVNDCSAFIKMDNEQEWALVRFILFNLSSEMAGHNGYAVETERNQLALIFNVSDASQSSQAYREQFIHSFKQEIEGRFKIKITIASSSIRQGISEIGGCYQEALNALDYQIVRGISSILYFEEMKESGLTYFHYPQEDEGKLLNCLKSGDFAGAEQLLDQLYRHNFTSNKISPEMGKGLFFGLLGTVMKLSNSLKLDNQQLFQHTSETVKFIGSSLSSEEMLEQIKQLCRLICSSIEEAKSQTTNKLNDQILEYILQQSSDNGLSLTSIADQFAMTPQYLSSFFKKHNNMNITDFIVGIRVKKAKSLLEATGLTVQQVAEKVGYATDIGFIRVFKKLEGVTPGKFREIALSKDQLSS